MNSNKTLAIAAFAISALTACAAASPQTGSGGPPAHPPDPCCWPPPCDCTVSMEGCPTVTFRVDRIATADGWGGHFSLGKRQDGYGGKRAECHITGGDGPDRNVALLCYDGALSQTAHANQYELRLGVRKEIDWAELEIRDGKVAVTVERRATSPHTSERIPYRIQSYFPLRDETDFCSGETIYYTVDGVLAGLSARDGSGYEVTVSP